MKYRTETEAAIQAACEAGNMLRENMEASREISFKGEVDLVTNFDRKAQCMIIDSLSAAFPAHDFLAEEGLSENRGAEFRWIIDPIDGTTNFAHRFPVFCVSIALEKAGQIILGVIYDPMREELFTAEKGSGARLNNLAIQVSATPKLDISLLSTGFPYDIRESRENNIQHFVRLVTRAQAIRRCGSAALDLCYVACGRFDGFWELKLNPWDIAAGALILEEAGGKVSDFHNRTMNIFKGEILGTNGLIHDQIVSVLGMGNNGAFNE